MLSDQQPQTPLADNQQDIQEAPEFWNPRRVRMLAGSVVVMSGMLLVGFGLVIYKLVEKTLLLGNTPPALGEAAIGEGEAQPGRGLGFTIDLKGYQIKNISHSADTITLHVAKGNSQQLWVVDRASKVVKQVIELNK